MKTYSFDKYKRQILINLINALSHFAGQYNAKKRSMIALQICFEDLFHLQISTGDVSIYLQRNRNVNAIVTSTTTANREPTTTPVAPVAAPAHFFNRA